jgi:hypothetical protein
MPFLSLFFLISDRSKVKSIRYRSWPYKVALGVFVVSFITLGWLGMEPVTKTNSILAHERYLIDFTLERSNHGNASKINSAENIPTTPGNCEPNLFQSFGK